MTNDQKLAEIKTNFKYLAMQAMHVDELELAVHLLKVANSIGEIGLPAALGEVKWTGVL